jgi:soluble lytic murein transglycosylase-like protein
MVHVSEKKRANLFYLVTFWIFLLCAFFANISFGQNSSTSQAKYENIISSLAQKHEVPPTLVHSIIKAESNYNAWAISPKGALGLMQLMPETAIQYQVNNVFDPKQNIEGGIKYLVDLIKLYNGDTEHVLAAYNAGQEAIKRYGGIPPYKETKNYIKTVMASYSKSKITTRTKIYSYYDENGKFVLTNNKALWEKYKKKSK